MTVIHTDKITAGVLCAGIRSDLTMSLVRLLSHIYSVHCVTSPYSCRMPMWYWQNQCCLHLLNIVKSNSQTTRIWQHETPESYFDPKHNLRMKKHGQGKCWYLCFTSGWLTGSYWRESDCLFHSDRAAAGLWAAVWWGGGWRWEASRLLTADGNGSCLQSGGGTCACMCVGLGR